MMFRVVILILLFLSQNNILTACNCELKNIEKEEKLVTEILIGKVIAKKINRQFTKFGEREIGGIQNSILVSKWIKGDLLESDTVQILTEDTDNICGFNFELGKTYLIYARYNFTNNCRRTREITTLGDEEVRYLLNDESTYPKPPIISYNRTSLSERQYYLFRNESPVITILDCDLDEDIVKCSKNINNEVSRYFVNNIDDRKIRQVFVLYIDEMGDISSYKVYKKEGFLAETEEDMIIQYIKNRYDFVSKGYGEIMSSGLFNILLEN